MFNFPEQINRHIKDKKYEDVSCRSNAKTYHFENGLFLKIDDKGELKRECLMTNVFYELGFGSKVVEYVSEDKDYLLTEEVVGENLTHLIEKPEKLCAFLAESLKKLHSISIKDIPISTRYERYLESLNGSFEGGYYDTSFLLNSKNLTKEEAWEIMQDNKSILKCDTFIHGDACLPNLIVCGDNFKAFIDTGMAGVGDRHIDIYWALWSLEYNLKTDKYNELFKEIYGKEKIDDNKLKVIEAFEVFG